MDNRAIVYRIRTVMAISSVGYSSTCGNLWKYQLAISSLIHMSTGSFGICELFFREIVLEIDWLTLLDSAYSPIVQIWNLCR